MQPDDLRSQWWRLHNLYSCRIEGIGKAIKFHPRPEQEIILRHLIDTPEKTAYVIKSRRLGISTAVDTFQTDAAAFTQGYRGLIIDLKQADATKKMVEIVRFAFDSLDPLIRRGFETDKRNDSELRIRHKKPDGTMEEESQDSVINATTGGRGGDCSMLHVSEWGKIAATDPTRSKEIRTGAFPAARKARKAVETTWYGGKGGDLWEMIKPVMEADPNADGVLYFFPWHSDPQAIRTEGMSTPEIEQYFMELAGKTGKTFSQEQKKWYAAAKIEQGIFVKREYPSTLDEAFSAPIEGSIYGDAIMTARGAGRIIPFEWNRSNPVYSSWDLGWEDSTTIWLFQLVGHDIHWIWHCEEKHHDAADMVRLLDATAIPVSAHYIPHDGGHKKPGEGKSYKDRLEEAGLVNVEVVPPCRSKWPGIDSLRSMLARSWFRLPFTEKGITALEAYHTKDSTSGGIIAKEPVHDWCLASGTKILTAGGWINVEDIGVHDNVLTPNGNRMVIRSGIVRWTTKWTTIKGIRCTREHRFFTSRGLVQAAELSSKDQLWTPNSSDLRILACLCVVFRFGLKTAITLAIPERAERTADRSCFIGWFMRLFTERFRIITKSITSTAIRSITTLITLPLSPDLSTEASTSQSRGLTAFAASVVKPLDVTRSSVQDAARSASVSTTQESNESAAPAYNLTIETDECYFVRGDDGGSYLVSNSSHSSDGARTAAEALELGMVRSSAARRQFIVAPRAPDGSVVDLGTVIQQRMRQRSGLAKSGTRRT